MDIRLAKMEELDDLCGFFGDVADKMGTMGFDISWERGVYPGRSDIEAAIAASSLHLAFEGNEQVGAFVLNAERSEGYRTVDWPSGICADDGLVLHMVCVHPEFQGRDLAKRLVTAAIVRARDLGARVLRLDTIRSNHVAVGLYEGLGFSRVACMPLPDEGTGDIEFILFELAL